MSRDKVKKLYDQYVTHFNAGEMSKVADLYTSDCKLFFSSMPVITGREAVVAQFTAMKKDGIAELKAETKELIECGDVIINRGVYTMCKEDKSIHETGNFMVIWKRVDGELKIYLDYSLSEHPPLVK